MNSIVRGLKDRDHPYCMILRKCLQDERLSWKARGLAAYILSLPDDWELNRADLIKRAPDGRESLDTGLRELEKFGYLRRQQSRDERGTFTQNVMEFFEDCNLIVSENPYRQPRTENPQQKVSENLFAENPSKTYQKDPFIAENPQLMNSSPQTDYPWTAFPPLINKQETNKTNNIMVEEFSKKEPNSRLSATTIPKPKVSEIALAGGIHPDWIDNVYEIFFDYWQGITSTKGKKSTVGWERAWRNWVMNSKAKFEYPKPASKIDFKAPHSEISPEIKDAAVKSIQTSSAPPDERKVRGVLIEKLGVPKYDSWFKLALLQIDGNKLVIKAANLYARDYIERNFKFDILRWFDYIKEISFEVNE